MKFCIKCGEKLKEDINFCTACGTPVERSADQINTGQEEEKTSESEVSKSPSIASPTETQTGGKKTKTESVPDSKKPMSKKSKILLSIVAVLAIILFGTHTWLKSYFDPMNDLLAMNEAISNDDMDTFLSYIEFEDDVILDKESFFEYIKEEEWNEIRTAYSHLIEREKENPTPLDKEIQSVTGDLLFHVKNKPIFMGLYNKYKLRAVPTKLYVYSNLENTEVTIKDTTLTIEQAEEYEEVGKIYPGEYDFKAITENEYGEFSYEDTALFFPGEEELEIQFAHESYYISATHGFEDAILFIDDKSIKQKIADIEYLGPFPEDSNSKLHAEWKNSSEDVVRSNSVILKDLNYPEVYFEFDETKTIVADATDEDDGEVGQFVLEFRDAYENAVNYGDYSSVESYLKPDSHADKELKKFIKDMKDGYYHYEFEKNTVLGVEEKDDKTYEVETNEQFTFIDEDNKIYEYDREKNYIVELVDEDYKISKIEYTDTQKSNVN